MNTKSFRSYIGGQRIINRTGFCSSALFVVVLGLLFFPLAHKTNTTEAATFDPAEPTLTLSTSNIDLVFKVTDTEGTFSASAPSTFSVSTNNATGYTLSIASTTDSDTYSQLINTDDNETAINSISSASTPAEFNVNNWGYLPSKLNSADNTLYQPAPTMEGTTIDVTNKANTEANEYSIALGVKANYNTKVGTYANSYVLTAVANRVGYQITYNKNTEDTVTNMPQNQAGQDISTIDNLTIPNTTPERADYEFIGWCDTIPANGVCPDSATTYQPGDTISLSQSNNNEITLYAMWKKMTINDITYMQDFATLSSEDKADVIASMSQDTAYELKDNRDGTTYHIQKLADGKVWLLDNLALDLTNSTVLNNLTASNTNATSTSLGYLKNGGGAENSQYATNGVSNWTSGNSYVSPLVNMASKDVVPNNAPANGQGNDKAGGYYNFCAASAGSYCYDDNDGSPEGANATEDICPAGWRMPTGNTTGEYSALANVIYGSTGSTSDTTKVANFRNALSLPLSGYFDNGSAYGQGSRGDFWSSTRNDEYNMYNLGVSTGGVGPAGSGDRFYGTSVRCLAKTPDTIITFNANGGTGTMVSQTITDTQVVAGTNQLTANTFTRDGYAFTGWNTKADGSGTPYSNSATYSGPSTTLYAQWQKLPIISELTYMQDFAGLSDAAKTNVINSMTQDTAYTLQDNRDGTTYHISKLADGKIWLLDNLALDLTNSTVLNNMTPENTNASATSLTSLKSGNRSAGDQYATAGVGNLTSGNNYSVPLVNMASKDVVPNNAPTNSKGNNKVGGYYNFCAASAGSYCYGDGTSYGTSSGNATEDICPAGWRMPTGDTTGEYSALANAIYGSTGSTSDTTKVANFRTALSLPLSGRFGSGSASYQGDVGYFWSSTRYNSNYMYSLIINTDGVYPVDGNSRLYGTSVRCLAK